MIAFQRVSISDQEPFDIVALELPEQTFVTQALWYVLPDGLSQRRCRPTSCSAPCTPPSTARSPSCR